MNSQTDRARGLFACLGDASRYRLVAALSAGERCVTELAREVALSQSCTTRHLQALQRVGLVSGERQGKRVVFRLCAEDPRVGGLLEWIRHESLEGTPGSRADSSSGSASAAAPAAKPRSRRGVGNRRSPAPPRAQHPTPDVHVLPPAPVPAPREDAEAAPRPPARNSRDLEDFLL